MLETIKRLEHTVSGQHVFSFSTKEIPDVNMFVERLIGEQEVGDGDDVVPVTLWRLANTGDIYLSLPAMLRVYPDMINVHTYIRSNFN